MAVHMSTIVDPKFVVGSNSLSNFLKFSFAIYHQYSQIAQVKPRAELLHQPIASDLIQRLKYPRPYNGKHVLAGRHHIASGVDRNSGGLFLQRRFRTRIGPRPERFGPYGYSIVI